MSLKVTKYTPSLSLDLDSVYSPKPGLLASPVKRSPLVPCLPNWLFSPLSSVGEVSKLISLSTPSSSFAVSVVCLVDSSCSLASSARSAFACRLDFRLLLDSFSCSSESSSSSSAIPLLGMMFFRMLNLYEGWPKTIMIKPYCQIHCTGFLPSII